MIDLEDLGTAYRKAKVDLYYSSHASLCAIADYEESLYVNLSYLLEKINGEDESWVTEASFIGGWTLAGKSVDTEGWKKHRKEEGNGLIFSSSAEEWEYGCKISADQKSIQRPTAEFRLMANCSIDFHVLSTLWILKVGCVFDAKLTSCAYGNRLRRTRDEKKVNLLSLGSFQPYLKPFRDWRDNGITAMRTALDANKKIVALTADINSFYHELNPDFMLDDSFIKNILGLESEILENPIRAKINRLFINALKAWSAATPLRKGLPVGLPASAVVANIALIELDRYIERQVVPIYYGRYVDDIMLVMENGTDFSSTVQLWEWLFARSGGVLDWVDGDKKGVCFKPDYLTKAESKIHFSNAKNKVFLLSGDAGKTLIDAIAHQIHQRSSEWRAMPRLPRSSEHISTDLLVATQSDGEAADNLRKANTLTMRRAGFALKLRDFEAYERDLLPSSWVKHRKYFFRAFIQHVLVLPQFFDLAIYLPRVIRLATACEDFDDLRRIINTTERLCQQVKDQCDVRVKALPNDADTPDDAELIGHWKNSLFSSIRENIAAAFPPRLSQAGKLLWTEHMDDYSWGCISFQVEDFLSFIFENNYKKFQSLQSRLFSFDLAHLPFRFMVLPKEMVAQRGIPPKTKIITCDENINLLLPFSILKGIKIIAKWTKFKDLPYGFLFATRPLNLPELFILNRNSYAQSEQRAMHDVVMSVRGFKLSEKAACFDKHSRILQIPDENPALKYSIAVSSWKTDDKSWIASVKRMADPDMYRYARLCHLIDEIISHPNSSRYLVLPELSLPAHWFIRVARKLQGRGISLIAGVEYLHAGRSKVHNQVWAALSHTGLGFPSLMIYMQDKQAPALKEERDLQQLAGLEMKPSKAWKIPPIIQHGDLRFSILICSELTNISYRAALRGKIDLLFVPEWNRDIESFNALVESSALDIHAYIVQCNDRCYGDSRIRAPFKDSWKRDVLRIKGGVNDYHVVGEVDVDTLRRFQSSMRSPSKPFKPVPDGFNEVMSHDRKRLPLVE